MNPSLSLKKGKFYYGRGALLTCPETGIEFVVIAPDDESLKEMILRSGIEEERLAPEKTMTIGVFPVKTNEGKVPPSMGMN